MKMGRTVKLFGGFILNIFIAPITISKVAGNIYNTSEQKSRKSAFLCGMVTLLFGSFVTFSILQFKFDWSWAIALFMYLGFCVCVATVRMHTREKLNISGHIVEDFASTLFFYPSVVLQLKMTLEDTFDTDMGSKTYIFDAPI